MYRNERSQLPAVKVKRKYQAERIRRLVCSCTMVPWVVRVSSRDDSDITSPGIEAMRQKAN